jgi:thiamine biosynthesis lipoprotein
VLNIAGVVGLSAVATPFALQFIADEKLKLHSWNGFALGGQTSLQLYCRSEVQAQQIFKKCLETLKQQEQFFSLYEPHSTISHLNKEGVLHNPPTAFVEVLRAAQYYSALTQGAFDVTVQPLWKLYKENPSSSEAQRKKALASVGYQKLHISDEKVWFDVPDMAITLNGLAQGYITDVIAAQLKLEGIENALVNMGEFYGMGRHVDGRLWQVGIRHPEEDSVQKVIELKDRAIATSGGYGTPLGKDSHHIFKPSTGKSAKEHKSVSVIAPTAIEADALSTAFYTMPNDEIDAVLKRLVDVEVVTL